MGGRYRQLTFAERGELARLQAQGRSFRQIAAALDRAPATIAREGQRNGSSRQRGYQVPYADQQARARRWRDAKLERDAALRERALARRKAGWSPEQVAGRLAEEAGGRWSPTRPSTAALTPQSGTARRTPDGTTGPGARRGGGGAPGKGRSAASLTARAWTSGRRRGTPASPPAIGRPT